MHRLILHDLKLIIREIDTENTTILVKCTLMAISE